MGLGNKAQATARDIEGSPGKPFGKVTMIEQNKLAGKAKQAQAKVNTYRGCQKTDLPMALIP